MIQTVGEIYAPSQKILLKMWHVHVPPGKRPLQRHFHTRFEITLVQSGGGTYTTDSGEHPMHPGDLFVFASNEFHTITDVSPEGLVITNLHFEPYYLQENAAGSLLDSYFNICYTHADTFRNRIPAEQGAVLRGLFEEIAQEMHTRRRAYEWSVYAHLQLFMVTLIRAHGYTAPQAAAFSQIQHLTQALRYIDKHFAENLTLDLLAAQAGITPTYFSALFKQAFSISPWDYLLTKRIEHAIHLLLTQPKQRNMLDIAVHCGFNNTANFNKQFKKLTGLTPSQYRADKEHIIH